MRAPGQACLQGSLAPQAQGDWREGGPSHGTGPRLSPHPAPPTRRLSLARVCAPAFIYGLFSHLRPASWAPLEELGAWRVSPQPAVWNPELPPTATPPPRPPCPSVILAFDISSLTSSFLEKEEQMSERQRWGPLGSPIHPPGL